MQTAVRLLHTRCGYFPWDVADSLSVPGGAEEGASRSSSCVGGIGISIWISLETPGWRKVIDTMLGAAIRMPTINNHPARRKTSPGIAV